MSRYVMDTRATEESRRLALLAAWADAGTMQCLDAVNVRAGWSCLEVGAGAGSIATWLCDRVGPSGSVLATDIDCRLLYPLDRPNFCVRQHDIVSDPLPEAAYDLIHARMVLGHLPARSQAMRSMTASLKPGGWLIIEDMDIASVVPACQTTREVTELFMKGSTALVRLLTAVGVDLEFGRHLHGELRSCNLVDISVEGRISVVANGSPLAQFWQLTWQLLRPQFIGSGLLAERDVDEFIALLGDGEFVWMAPAIMAAWGRRRST